LRFCIGEKTRKIAPYRHKNRWNEPPRKRVENSNANENKQLTSPIIAQNTVYAANFAPLLHLF